MPSKIKLWNDEIKRLRIEIDKLEAKKKAKARKKRDAKKGRDAKKVKKTRAHAEASTIDSKSSIIQAEGRQEKTRAHTEASTIDSKPSIIQAEGRQEKTNDHKDVIAKTWTRASKARIAADNAVAELRDLRIEGNASTDKIAAARQNVESRKEAAAKLEIAAILAEDDAAGELGQKEIVGFENSSDSFLVKVKQKELPENDEQKHQRRTARSATELPNLPIHPLASSTSSPSAGPSLNAPRLDADLLPLAKRKATENLDAGRAEKKARNIGTRELLERKLAVAEDRFSVAKREEAKWRAMMQEEGGKARQLRLQIETLEFTDHDPLL